MAKTGTDFSSLLEDLKRKGRAETTGLEIVALAGKERFLLLRGLARLRELVLGATPAEANAGLAALNHDIIDGKGATAADIVSCARTLPMMASHRLVEVQGVDGMSASSQNDLVSYLDAPEPATTLVLIADKADLRTKLFSTLSKRGWLFLFEPPKERELGAFVEREVSRRQARIERGAAVLLAELIGAELGQLSEAIEKLCLSVGATERPISESDVESLVRQTKSASPFDFARAVGDRDTSAALNLLRTLLRQKESPIALVALLERQLRLLLVAKTHLALGGRRAELPSRLGVPPFAVDAMLRSAEQWTTRALEQALGAAFACDRALKSSKLDDETEMTRLVLGLGRGAKPGRAEGMARAGRPRPIF